MKKILIIDDEEANVRALAMPLRNDGFEVVAAYSGKEGLDRYIRESPDLVLTDIKMPGMDGIDVLKNIKARDADAAVIIITGHGDMQKAIDALKFGASDVTNKPVSDEALTLAIQRALEKRFVQSQLRDYTQTLEQKGIPYPPDDGSGLPYQSRVHRSVDLASMSDQPDIQRHRCLPL